MPIQVRLGTKVSVSDLSLTIPEWHEIKAGTVGIGPGGVDLLDIYLAGEVVQNPGYEFCQDWDGPAELRIKTEHREGFQVFTGRIAEMVSYGQSHGCGRFRLILTCNTAMLVA